MPPAGLAGALHTFSLSFAPQTVGRRMGWALAYGFNKAILSTVGKCLDVDTCCPLHARVTLYTADTIVRTGSEPTGRHFSLKLVKH